MIEVEYKYTARYGLANQEFFSCLQLYLATYDNIFR